MEQNYVIVTLCVAKFPVHLAEARIFRSRKIASFFPGSAASAQQWLWTKVPFTHIVRCALLRYRMCEFHR